MNRRADFSDDDAPELTSARAAWLVSAADFDGDIERVADFIAARERFLRKAEAIGIPRETFLPFDPTKPGFEERAKVLMRLPKAVGWAAD